MLSKNYLLTIIQKSFYFFPVAFIAGSIILNLNLIFFLILGSFYIFLNKIKIEFNLANISLLLFFIILIFSSYLRIDMIGKENFYKSVYLLRFFLLFILIETLFKNKKINLKYFFYVCFFSSFFLSLDLLLQFFYGKNILGFEPWEGRITGVFQDEAVAGAYLQKLFLFFLIATITLFNQNKISHNSKSILAIIAVIFACFIASNRTSFFILILSIFFFILFLKIFRKRLLICILIILPCFYYFYQNDTQIYERYKGFVKKIYVLYDFNKLSQNSDIENISKKPSIINDGNEIRLPNHGKIYLTTLKSFQENKIFGNGLKSFRYNCKNFLNQKNTLCSTHPHNYHLEVLHDSGIIGFAILTLFVFFLLLSAYKNFKSPKINYYEKLLIGLIVFNFLIELFPLKSTGSIFTSWNGTLLWLSVSLVNFGNYINYNERK